MLKPYKFRIVAVAQEVDDDGNVVGEATITKHNEPFNVYGCEALKAWADEFPALLDQAQRPG